MCLEALSSNPSTAKKKNLGMQYMPIVPAAWEAEVEGSQSKDPLDKSTRPYLENELKSKKTGIWLKW
jgi:hypothetical protein